MALPFVSICIPAFRAEKFLSAALASVRAQTFADWEVIVTEDGSKDRAEEIVRRFGSTGPQSVIYNRHAVNKGLSATRNTGFSVARGTWIAFLDADDLWEPTHLETLVATARASAADVDLIHGGSQIFDDATGNPLEVRAPTPEDLRTFPSSVYRTSYIIQPSSAMVRRSRLSHFGGFSERFPICNDLEFWLRVASKGGKFAYTGKVTCLYRKHGEALSQKSAALISETAVICEIYSDWPAVDAETRRTRPAELYRFAGQILLRKNPAEARSLFRRALRLTPYAPKATTYWLASVGLGLLRSRPDAGASAAAPARTPAG